MDNFGSFVVGLVLAFCIVAFFTMEAEVSACPAVKTTICSLIYSIDDDCDGIDFVNQTDGPNYDYKCKNINNFRHINIREGL